MAAIAIAAIVIGNPVYLIMIAIVIGLCVGELARLLQPDNQLHFNMMGALATVVVVVVGFGMNNAHPVQGFMTMNALLLFVPPVLGAILIRKHRFLFLAYCSLIMLAGLGFVVMGPGPLLIWFILLIITSDVAGYFFGRIMGGPKFWPRVSPKKTWSGTVAGWVGALVIGLIGASQGVFTPLEAMLAPLIAFAGQMGDIIESAIKRFVNVKDSSNLIPGHGGFLDRFDAMIGAAGALMLLSGLASLMAG